MCISVFSNDTSQTPILFLCTQNLFLHQFQNNDHTQQNSLETHCPGGFIEECPDGQSCYGGLPCNVKDIIEEQSPADEAEGGGKVPGRLDQHSPKRNNFCGKSWSDANSKCGMWYVKWLCVVENVPSIYHIVPI